jgi:hypothetical protein
MLANGCGQPGQAVTFTDTDLELTAAARLGTLVTGIVPAFWYPNVGLPR